MNLKSMRSTKGWSQEQMAEISGVSVRTIQRIEKGEAPSLETAKALAAAFEQPIDEFQTALTQAENGDRPAPNPVLKHGWKGLFVNAGALMVVVTWLFFLQAQFGIDRAFIAWVAMTWGIGIAAHLVHLLNVEE